MIFTTTTPHAPLPAAGGHTMIATAGNPQGPGARRRAALAALGAIALFLLFFTQGAAAAEGAWAPVGPQPCAPMAAIRKVDAITAEAQLLYLPELPSIPVTFMVAAVDVGQMALGGLGLFITLIGYHFTIGKYIRQQAGVKDTQTMEIAGQPIEMKATPIYVTHPELERHLETYVTGDALHAVEKALDSKIEENFRELDRKRSGSIGNLHEHLTGTTKSLTEKIEHASARQHDRMEAMSTSMRGEFDAKLAEVRSDITDLPGRIIALLQQTGQIGRGGKP